MRKILKITFIVVITLIAISTYVKAVEVTNWSEFKTAIEGEDQTVKLANDIVGETQTVNIVGTKTLDLNGKTLTINKTGGRLIVNNGNLTITGNGIMQNILESYGLIDNYGTLNILNGKFIDKGGGDGSSFKNRGGTINIVDGEFIIEEHPTGNAVVYSDGTLNITGGKYNSKSGGPYSGAYPIVVNTGSANISNVNVTGTKGGIGINSGNVVIDSGSFTGGAYYGIWITNDYGQTNVKINGGTFRGEKYGLYASVDDGNQDASNAAIEINRGTFIGTKSGATAVNTANSSQNWSIAIKGGTYSSDVKKYVADGYVQYKAEENYNVTKITQTSNEFYVQVGGEPVSLGLNFEDENAKEYLELEGNDIVKVNKSDLTIEGLKAGRTVITEKLSDYEKNITVIAYEVKPANDSEGIREAADIAEDIVKDIIEGKDVVGLTETQKQAIKDVVDSGKTIILELDLDNLNKEEIAQDVVKIEEMLKSGEKIAGYYDINVVLKDADTNEEIVKLTNLASAIQITVNVPERLPKLQEGYTRTYIVIRMHKGVAEKLENVKDNQDGTITFETSKFSTYAIAYIDVVSQNQNEENNIDNNENKVEENSAGENVVTASNKTLTSLNPITGDNILIFVAILGIALIGIIATVKMNSKSKENGEH